MITFDLRLESATTAALRIDHLMISSFSLNYQLHPQSLCKLMTGIFFYASAPRNCKDVLHTS